MRRSVLALPLIALSLGLVTHTGAFARSGDAPPAEALANEEVGDAAQETTEEDVELPEGLLKKTGEIDFSVSSRVIAQRPGVANALAVMEQDPSDATAWHRLGIELMNEGAFKDAVNALRRSVKIDRLSHEAWTDLGAASLRGAQTSAGISALQKALKIEPYSALAHYNLGLAYQSTRDFAKMLDSFERALLIDPRLGDSHFNPNVAINEQLGYAKLRAAMRRNGDTPALPTTVMAEGRKLSQRPFPSNGNGLRHP